MLGVQYALAHPQGVKSLVLASPALSTARWVEDADSLILTRPDSLQQAITEHEAAGTYDAPEYQEAVMAFYRLYLARKQPWSADINSTSRNSTQRSTGTCGDRASSRPQARCGTSM